MLRRYICCFAKGGACDRANKVNNSDAPHKSSGGTDSKLDHHKQQPEEKKSANAKASGKNLSPVLVELFTSQGCSSCPPADLLFSQLGQRATSDDVTLEVPIVILCFHVEYWDYLGWRDPFATGEWTLRQRTYGQVLQQDSIYTPEVVVQGRAHCIGSTLEPVLALIHAAPRFPAPEITATYKLVTNPVYSLEISLEFVLRFKVEDSLDVMIALFENGLVTSCFKGENRGRILTNDFVVRSMTRVAIVRDWPAKKAIRAELSIPLWVTFSKAKCGGVLFLQNPTTMEVQGAQLLEFPDDLIPLS